MPRQPIVALCAIVTTSLALATSARAQPAEDEDLQALRARSEIQRLSSLVQTFRIIHGRLPATLDELTQPVAGEEALADRIDDDPWGAPYRYQTTAGDFSLYSTGPDGTPRTDDDIGLAPPAPTILTPDPARGNEPGYAASVALVHNLVEEACVANRLQWPTSYRDSGFFWRSPDDPDLDVLVILSEGTFSGPAESEPFTQVVAALETTARVKVRNVDLQDWPDRDGFQVELTVSAIVSPSDPVSLWPSALPLPEQLETGLADDDLVQTLAALGASLRTLSDEGHLASISHVSIDTRRDHVAVEGRAVEGSSDAIAERIARTACIGDGVLRVGDHEYPVGAGEGSLLATDQLWTAIAQLPPLDATVDDAVAGSMEMELRADLACGQ